MRRPAGGASPDPGPFLACRTILAGLDALTDEERRALLGRLVRTIVVYDDRIEVRGLLPADASTQLFGSCP
jgi:hypothetical protein